MTDRARVPFALVGVLLVVGSLLYAATATHQPATTDRTAERALDTATETARPVIRHAARRAAVAAIRTPVIEPANTTAGRALDPETPFRDALRLRIYRQTADALARSDSRVGTVRVDASLPRRDSPRARIDSVELRPVRNDTALRVRIHNVSFAASRGGRQLRDTRTSITVTIAVPAVAIHDRVTRYERQLNRSPTAGPGLGRRLTGRLLPIAAARGLAQYGGADIDNVVGNRHVELATNGATLALQRATFGRADPESRAAFGRALTRVGLTDTVSGTTGSFADGVVTTTRERAADQLTLGPANQSRTTTVGVNRTADAAAADLTAGRLDQLLRATHRTPVVRRASATVVNHTTPPPVESPGPDWIRVWSRTTTQATVTHATRVQSDAIAASQRRVVVTHVRRTRWGNATTTRTTTARWQTTHRVRLSVAARYAPSVPGPDQPTVTPFADQPAVREQARARLPVTGQAADRLAINVVKTTNRTDRVTIAAEVPRATRIAALRAMFALRDRVRNVSVTLDHRELVGGVTASDRLAATLRDRRAQLLDAPSRYTSARERAVAAARAAYLDRVVTRLRDRPTVGDRLKSVLSNVGVQADEAAREAARATRPEPAAFGHGPAGTVSFVPNAEPAYLPVTRVDASLIDNHDRAVTPLAVRNWNVFSLPFGDAATAAIGDLAPSDQTVRLQTAGRAAVGARRTLTRVRAANNTAPALASCLETLDERLDESVTSLERTAATTLARETRLDDAEAARLAAAARHPQPGVAAIAVANGTYTTRLAAATADRLDLSRPVRERLAVRLDAVLREQATSIDVSRRLVNQTVSARRAVLRETLVDGLATGTRRAASRLAEKRAVPPLAGLPLAPVPGYWYATVNVWFVEVRGLYPRFSVGVRHGKAGIQTLRYVRENASVAFDADGDGDPERVGRNRPITFETRAVAFAVVPAGKQGVGDLTADERSPAWPSVRNRSNNRFAESPEKTTMLYETVTAGDDTPSAVRSAYGERLRAAVADHDPAAIADRAGVEKEIVDSFADGETSRGSLTDAAAVLSAAEQLDATTVENELRDQLMLGMSSAILDVDTIAAEIETDLTGQELQQALEGRTPISLDELAKVHALIKRRQP